MSHVNRGDAFWALWIAASLGLAGLLGYLLLAGEDRTVFMPGAMSDAHYQIGLACGACHLDPFSGEAVLQEACLGCHAEQMAAMDDSHPKAKFTDPRNAALLAGVDARFCITCHVEHRPEITGPMQVTLPIDFCANCHQDIAEDRPSHAGMGFATCADAGCHNFHDNRALYEDFLVAHLNEPAFLEVARVTHKRRGIAPRHPPLTAADADAPAVMLGDGTVLSEWLASAHAAAGVNCGGCHRPAEVKEWIERPGIEVCAGCHTRQTEGFRTGKHGMRLHPALESPLPPMTPGEARLPMAMAARERTLTCTSCHGAHEFDVRNAAVKACLGCHADPHSESFRDTPHHALWLAEIAGEAPPGAGVSCATCHLPPVEVQGPDGEPRWVTEHNQSLNLRPNEKMLRSVCMDCHGLRFALDALADPDLVRGNFHRSPSVHVPSLDMVEARLEGRPAPGVPEPGEGSPQPQEVKRDESQALP